MPVVVVIAPALPLCR